MAAGAPSPDDRRHPAAPPDRRRTPLVIPRSVVAVFILGFGLTTVGFYVLQHRAQVRFDRQQAAIARQQETLFDAQYGSCLRVNRLRSNDNRNAVTEYDTLTIIVELTKGPTPVRAAEIKRVLDALNRTNPQVVRAIVELMRPVPGLDKRFRARARQIKYIPSTDCDRAVGTPAQFAAPRAVPLHRLNHAELRELRQTGTIRPMAGLVH